MFCGQRVLKDGFEYSNAGGAFYNYTISMTNPGQWVRPKGYTGEKCCIAGCGCEKKIAMAIPI